MDDPNYNWDQVPLPSDSQSTNGTFFAYPADIKAYQDAIANGATEQEALQVGDNGRGRWGSDTTTDEPQVALPPGEIINHWGSVDAGKNKLVDVYGPGGRVVRARVADVAPHGKLDLNPGSAKALFPNGASDAAIKQGHVGLAYRPVGQDFSGQLASDLSNQPLAAGPIDPQAAQAIADRQSAITDETDGGESDTGTDTGEDTGAPEIAAARQNKPLDLDIGGLIKSPVVSDNGQIKKYQSGLVVNRAAGIMTYIDPTTQKVYQGDRDGKWMDVTPANKGKPNVRRDPTTNKWFDFTDPSNPKEIQLPGSKNDIDPSATGEAALAGLTAEEKTFVRRIANYQQKAPNPSFRNPNAIKLLGRVAMYNPNYNEQYYGIDKDFASTMSTKPGGQIVAANTAIRHLGEAQDALDRLQNSKFRGYNTLQNMIKKQVNDPDLSAYQAAISNLGPELAKAFTGNVAALDTIRAQVSNFDAAKSPEAAKASIITTAQMLNQRLDEVGAKYQDAFGKPYPTLYHAPAAQRLSQWGLMGPGEAAMGAARKAFTTSDGRTVYSGDKVAGPNGETLTVQDDGTAH